MVMGDTASGDAVLEVEGLTCEFLTEEGPAQAVRGVDFHVARGETLGLVGESGCGKSATGLALMGLLPLPAGRVASGRIVLEGEALLKLRERQMRDLRGDRIAMVFQEPMTALNPVMVVGEQVAEVLRRHRGIGRRQARDRAVALLEEVGIPAAVERARDYPHQLSGGMRQRVVIAMAIACEPALLIADEPTTALDVTIQAQILDLLRSLQRRTGMAVLLITHDLGVVAQVCHRVLVMYAGQIVEAGPVAEVFDSPLHPYTEGLLRSVPGSHEGSPPGHEGEVEPGPGRRRLQEIPGSVPPISHRPPGCTFGPRCHLARDRCRQEPPRLRELSAGRLARCHFPLPAGSGEGSP